MLTRVAIATVLMVSSGVALAQSREGGTIEQADANQDGKVTRQEYIDARAAQFARMDRNGDGVVDETDSRERADQSFLGKRATAAMRGRIDTNSDGKISKDEFVNSPTVLFDRFDADKNNELDAKQLEWLDQTLSTSQEPWKIAYFHHPIYSNGKRHGSNVELRIRLEPLFLRHGVQVVFSGHDHMYERLKPQKGITYFVVGSGGQLREGGVRRSETTAAANDQEQLFLLVDVDREALRFQAITRNGAVIDSGAVQRQPST